MRTLAVIALKGGSGKTTIAAHVALAAHLRGVDTLVVDTDPQQSTTQVLGAREGPGPDCLAVEAAKLLSAQIGAGRLRKHLLIVDTPAGVLEDVTEAIVLADFALMVVRPTLLDLAALARTVGLVRRLGKPAMVVVNQAPVARAGQEAPQVKRALRALEYMRLQICPTIVRTRTVYQTALETGRSAEELGDAAAAKEIAGLWEFLGGVWDAEPQAAHA